MYTSIVSFTLRSASRRVRRCETQPGRAGTVATYASSLLSRMTTVNLMSLSPHVRSLALAARIGGQCLPYSTRLTTHDEIRRAQACDSA